MPSIAMLLSGAVAGSPPIPPTGLVAHYDAALDVTTSGGNVTQWNDQVGSNDLTSITSDPALVTGVVNGLPVVRFDGNDALITGSMSLTRPDDATVWAVCATSSGSLTNAAAIGISDNGAHAGLNIGAGATANRVGGLADNLGWATSHDSISASGTFDILVIKRTGSTVELFRNGALCAPAFSGAPIVVANYSVSVGQIPGGGTFWSGDVAEAGVYDVALTGSDETDFYTTLGAKYGIGILTVLSRGSWTASASSTLTIFVPANTIDGNLSTRWLSGGVPTANVDYFEIDMGSAQSVGAVRVITTDTTSIPDSGDVQWSDDNSSWTTVASWTYTPNLIIASWTAQSHRYWRLLATAATHDSGLWSIHELDLYDVT